MATLIFPKQSVDSFHAAVRSQILEELRGLDPVALLEVKRLIRAGLKDKNDPDAVNLRESFGMILSPDPVRLLSCISPGRPICEWYPSRAVRQVSSKGN
ncbi:hypothetical protein C0993_011539 [Termitomyces sp. T159_Od127]|nr:hypothetical protein C0993_011539 [Termitomyces sp. T159_Od127]